MGRRYPHATTTVGWASKQVEKFGQNEDKTGTGNGQGQAWRDGREPRIFQESCGITQGTEVKHSATWEWIEVEIDLARMSIGYATPMILS